jgi:hypothetical protein
MTKLREAAGGAYERRGQLFIRVTVGPQKRASEHAPWATKLEDATARAREVQALVNRLRAAGKTDFVDKLVEVGAAADAAKMVELSGAVDRIIGDDMVQAPPKVASDVVTYEAFALQWVKGELHALYPDDVERKRSAYQDLCNLRRYVFPVIGPKALADVTLDDYQQIMREADGRRSRKAKLSPATRRQIGQAARHVLQLAVYPARHIAINPIPDSALPKKKAGPGQQFIAPDEDALAMADERADVGVRLLFGFLHRQGPRKADALGGAAEKVDDAIDDEDAFGDVPALTWGRVDLRRGYILPDRNKTDDASLTPLEPDLVRALKAWKAMCSKTRASDPVFVTKAGEPIDPDEATELYRSTMRAALVAADADRPELWTPPRGQMGLRLHDARASFVTVALVNGRTEEWVRRRSKHKSSAIERYRRQLGTWRELSLGDWTPLDEAIPEIAEQVAKLAAAERGGESGEGPRASANDTEIPRASAPAVPLVRPGGLGVGGSNPLAPTGSSS